MNQHQTSAIWRRLLAHAALVAVKRRKVPQLILGLNPLISQLPEGFPLAPFEGVELPDYTDPCSHPKDENSQPNS